MKNTPFSTLLVVNIFVLKHIIKVQRLEIEEKEEKIEDLERDIRLFCFKSLDEAHKRSKAFDRGFNAGLVYNPNRPPFDISDDECPDVYDRCDEDEGPDVYGVLDDY